MFVLAPHTLNFTFPVHPTLYIHTWSIFQFLFLKLDQKGLPEPCSFIILLIIVFSISPVASKYLSIV